MIMTVTSMLDNVLRIATRQSPLALWQAHYVKDKLMASHPGLVVELVPMVTRGDVILDTPLAKVGGKGLFVKELEVALLENRADITVHPMKDVPVEFPQGLGLVTICEREDPRDAFVSNNYDSLDALPAGSIVGTSSLRRQCQLAERRPDLIIRSLRGNVGTRLSKLDNGEYDAIILAAAGLERLGIIEKTDNVLRSKAYKNIERLAVSRGENPAETEASNKNDIFVVGNGSAECVEVHKDKLKFRYLSTESMLPAACQGIIAIETRTSGEACYMVREINDTEAYTQLICERAVLNRLNAGCHEPIGVYSELDGGRMKLSLMKADAASSDKDKDEEIQIHRKTVEGNTAEWEQLVENLIK